MALNRVDKYKVEKFDGSGNFRLWQRRIKDILTQQDLSKALREKKPNDMDQVDWEELKEKAVRTIWLYLSDEVRYNVMDLTSPTKVLETLEKQFISNSLTNKLSLKCRLYGLTMREGTDLQQHINAFNQIIYDMQKLDVKIDDEDKAIILLCSLPKSYEHMVTILTYGKDSIKLDQITAALPFHNKRRQNVKE